MAQPQQYDNELKIWNTKLGRSVVPIAIGLVCVPVVLTVLVLGKVGRDQIRSTVTVMANINRRATQDAGEQFQQLGRETIERSSREAADISTRAVHNFSAREQRLQSSYLKSAAAESITVTEATLSNSTRDSVHTHRRILDRVSRQMGSIVAQSTQQAQQRAVERIESAMMSEIDAVMEERAQELAQKVIDNIQIHQNYLALTAQMPEFANGDSAGQRAILDELIRRYPMFKEVAAVDASGHETAKSASDHIVTNADLRDCGSADYFKSAMKDKQTLAIDELPYERAPILRIATPIEELNGRPAGILTARVSLSDAWDELGATRIGDSGFAYVTDEIGHSLLSPPRAGELLRQSANIDLLGWVVYVAEPTAEVMRPIHLLQDDIAATNQAALTNLRTDMRAESTAADGDMESGAASLQASAQRQVDARSRAVFDRFRAGAKQQSDAELSRLQAAIQAQAVTAETDNDARMVNAIRSASDLIAMRLRPLADSASQDASRRLSVMTIAIMACSSILGVIVAFLLAARIVRPVIRLAKRTRDLASGDLDKRVDEHAPGEIRDLAVAFNTMAASLQASRNDLQVAETQLVHSAKLASLGTLSAGVAHELNQPLAIIRGISQQLQEESGLTDFVRQDLTVIEGQTSRMMKIVKHLRTFSRVGSPELGETDVNQIIHDCFILIGAQLRAHDIAVELDLGDGLPMVMGDTNELEQVFLNLISNARDALDGRPEPRLTIRTRLEQGSVVAEFTDNGPGIPEQIAEHVFDPFFTTKEPGKGTGLGLSISHSIIERHHGSISVRNGCDEGDGATFRIVLPQLHDEYRAPMAA
jgi:signal transduction histidine kinase